MGLHHGTAPAPGAQRLRSVRLALAVSVGLTVAKLLAFWSTGLLVMLAEALHSLTDVLQTAFLLVAARLSAAPPDEAHPFGHGRGENLAAILLSMVVVFLIATELVRHTLESFQAPRPPPEVPLLALGVMAGSALLMVWPLVLARRDQATGGVVKAQAMESLNDLLGAAAAIGGILLVMAGWAQADAAASLVVAAIIVYNAIQLFRANLPYLVGGSPPQAYYREVEAIAREVPGTLGVHALAAEYIGPSQVHLDMHLAVPADMPVKEAGRIAEKVRDRLEGELPGSHVSVHFCSGKGDLRRVGRDHAPVRRKARDE